jgi:hypothetical protein
MNRRKVLATGTASGTSGLLPALSRANSGLQESRTGSSPAMSAMTVP